MMSESSTTTTTTTTNSSGCNVVSGGFIPEMEVIISQLERGTVVTKFFFRKRPERRTLSVKRETRQVVWQRSVTGRNVCEGAIDLREVKEVRHGKSSKDFEKWADDSKRHDASKCFIVVYGTEFRLRTLSIAALSEKECELWMKGLKFLVSDTLQASYPVQLEVWLRKEFYTLENTRGNITLKDMKVFMPKINCKMSTGKLREIFEYVDTRKSGEIGFDDFTTIFHRLLNDNTIFTDNLSNYSLDRYQVTLQEFQCFLETEQKEIPKSSEEISKFIREYLQDPTRDTHEPYFTTFEFVDFLFSKQNEIWNPTDSVVNQDMTRPMSHYWISSSHNTYLTGDQFSSESSVEAYARCLLMGCRCIELDCWDGPDSQIHIFHGHTLTTKIKFIDVVKCIKEHAFTTSQYPVILSIEDHCTLPLQRKMAQIFQEVFGDMLVAQNLDKNESQLPSPEQLKRRILLKHKKLPDGVDESTFVSKNDDSKDMDLSNTIKNGVMYLEDVETQKWNPHFFVLTQSKLLYTEVTNPPESNDEVEEDEEQDLADTLSDSSDKPNSRQEELHFSEKWFHGRLKGGRNAANALIEKYKLYGDGTFLVRESDTFVGDYTLSFWRRGRTNHCHIHSKYQWGQIKYYLVETLTFDSLYSLITYYRSNPIRGLEFHIVLKEPVPQPQSHEDKPWFHGSIDRVQAEDKVKRIPREGAFLVRLVQHGDSRFGITFRADKRIKHCVIKEDGRLFTVGLNKFETLVDLVNYYEKHPFYNRVSLTLPVTDELIRHMGVNPDEHDDVYAHPEYLDTHIFNRTLLQVRAIYDYIARRDDELSFSANSIITNVIQEHEDWWVGEYEGKQGWFPVNYVELLSPSEDDLNNSDQADTTPLGSLQKGSVEMMGAYIELARNDYNIDLPFLLKIYVDTTMPAFIAAVSSAQEAKDWHDAIKETAQSASDRENKNKKMERMNRIAKELSCLIIYCCSVNKFVMERVKTKGRIFYEMSSFPETAAEKLMCQQEAKFFMWYHQVQFSRVYPKGQRLDSSNYNPVPLWNAGCQMVSLNFQTPDKPMQLNQAKFRQNGNCGYVLRPEFMFNDNFDPSSKASLVDIDTKILTIRIIGARHLSKSGRGIVSPFVEIELIGADYSGNVSTSQKTKTIADNGFNPIWNESFDFEVPIPDLAMIRFVVQDEDMFGDPNFIGQATYPVLCMRQGYRSVPLQSSASEDLELAYLLVHLTVKSATEEEQEIIRLKESLPLLSKEIVESVKEGDRMKEVNIRNKFRKTQDQIITLIESQRLRKRAKSHAGMASSSVLPHIASSSSANLLSLESVPASGPKRSHSVHSYPFV